MRTARAVLSVTSLVVTVFISTASGGAPMGPPMALLEEGQWAVGGEYGREQIDLQGAGLFNATYVEDGVFSYDFVEALGIQDMEMNMIFGTLAYGVCDDWDVFLRLGAADAKDDMVGASDVVDYGIPGAYSLGTLDGSFGFAWGAGTRTTFCRQGPWSFGGLMQVTWFEPGDSDVAYADPILEDPDVVHVGEARLDYWQAQVSLAAVYQVDTLSFWAGPFVQFFEGDIERSGIILLDGEGYGDSFSASGEIEEISQFGGHFGANWDMADQWNLWVEGQVTGDSWVIGVGALFLPQEAF